MIGETRILFHKGFIFIRLLLLSIVGFVQVEELPNLEHVLVEALFEVFDLLEFEDALLLLAVPALLVPLELLLLALLLELLARAHYILTLVEHIEGLRVGVDGDECVGVLRVLVFDLVVMPLLIGHHLALRDLRGLPRLAVDVTDDKD